MVFGIFLLLGYNFAILLNTPLFIRLSSLVKGTGTRYQVPGMDGKNNFMEKFKYHII